MIVWTEHDCWEILGIAGSNDLGTDIMDSESEFQIFLARFA